MAGRLGRLDRDLLHLVRHLGRQLPAEAHDFRHAGDHLQRVVDLVRDLGQDHAGVVRRLMYARSAVKNARSVVAGAGVLA